MNSLAIPSGRSTRSAAEESSYFSEAMCAIRAVQLGSRCDGRQDPVVRLAELINNSKK